MSISGDGIFLVEIQLDLYVIIRPYAFFPSASLLIVANVLGI